MSVPRPVVGVDIGGSGIKAALVDTGLGALVGERVRVPTPQPAVPAAVISIVAELVSQLAPSGPVGVGVPAPIVRGVATMAANIDPTWVGVMAEQELATALGRPCAVLNDADAAGLAEVRFGAGRGVPGVVLVLTLGTGIGSALFIDGRLVPNTELGHIEIRGKDGERRASAGARERRGMSYREWAPLLEEFIRRVDRLIWPDLVIIGGGISKKADRYLPLLSVRPPLVPARLQNEAGIVGAALRAVEMADVIPRPEPAQPRREGAST
jgi:polyphosphate glucokinase